MKKILLTFAAVTATCMVLMCGCTKCKDWPETPVVHDIVTSDCHNSDYLDCAFGEAAQLARACGFKSAWEYRGSEAVEYTL
jgi:hypothetical protein